MDKIGGAVDWINDPGWLNTQLNSFTLCTALFPQKQVIRKGCSQFGEYQLFHLFVGLGDQVVGLVVFAVKLLLFAPCCGDQGAGSDGNVFGNFSSL